MFVIEVLYFRFWNFVHKSITLEWNRQKTRLEPYPDLFIDPYNNLAPQENGVAIYAWNMLLLALRIA